jgi:Tfp pilus assembly protein PilV
MKIEMSRESRVESRKLRAFTLLEVMIAVAIFFMATFSILALVTQCLRSAHSLHQNAPTPGMVAAELALTNKLEEGFDSGDFEDLAAGVYPDYTWERETLFYASNGMFQINIGVFRNGALESSMSTLLYRPESPTGVGTQSRFR